MEIFVHLTLEKAWRQAEVDFQTFVALGGEDRRLESLENARELDPELLESEWSLRIGEIVSRLVNVREVSYDSDAFRARIELPESAPEGIGSLVNALVRAYVVKCLLGAWNDLRHVGLPYDWRRDAARVLESLTEILGSVSRGRAAGRRVIPFP